MTFTGDVSGTESVDIPLHTLVYLMIFSALFKDSWQELGDFLQQCGNDMYDFDFFAFFIIVPVNEIVSDAIAMFNAGGRYGRCRTKVQNFLINQFLMEYFVGIVEYGDRVKDTVEDQEHEHEYSKDIKMFMDLMKVKDKGRASKFPEREVNSFNKMVCLLYAYYMKECKF